MASWLIAIASWRSGSQTFSDSSGGCGRLCPTRAAVAGHSARFAAKLFAGSGSIAIHTRRTINPPTFPPTGRVLVLDNLLIKLVGGSRIRTCGPLLPKQVLYQAELCPEPHIGAGSVSIFCMP